VPGNESQNFIHIAAAESLQAQFMIQRGVRKWTPASGWINPDKGCVSVEHDEKLEPRLKKQEVCHGQSATPYFDETACLDYTYNTKY
jgi:hypothetical protein